MCLSFVSEICNHAHHVTVDNLDVPVVAEAVVRDILASGTTSCPSPSLSAHLSLCQLPSTVDTKSRINFFMCICPLEGNTAVKILESVGSSKALSKARYLRVATSMSNLLRPLNQYQVLAGMCFQAV